MRLAYTEVDFLLNHSTATITPLLVTGGPVPKAVLKPTDKPRVFRVQLRLTVQQYLNEELQPNQKAVVVGIACAEVCCYTFELLTS